MSSIQIIHQIQDIQTKADFLRFAEAASQWTKLDMSAYRQEAGAYNLSMECLLTDFKAHIIAIADKRFRNY